MFWLIAEGHIVETMSWLPLLRTGAGHCRPLAAGDQKKKKREKRGKKWKNDQVRIK